MNRMICRLTTPTVATLTRGVLLAMAAALAMTSHLSAQTPARERAAVGSIAEIIDFDSVSKLKPWATKQASTGLLDHHCDYGIFVRKEPGRRYVMLDTKGRGCIDRFWTVYKKGNPELVNYDLLIYIDNDEKPAIKVDLNDFFNGKHSPFVEPLTGRCGFGKEHAMMRSSYCQTPIGFEKSCKIVVVQRDPEDKYSWRTPKDPYGHRPLFFYQIAYRLCEADVPVKTFTWDLDANEKAALEKVKKLWGNCGQSPWQTTDLVRSESKTFTVGEGQGAELLQIGTPGILREILIQVKPENDTVAARQALIESLWIDMTWDDAEKPQVSAPISVFFMGPDDKVNTTGFWIGCKDRQYYCYLPMPFFKNAKIAVRSTKSAPANTQIIAKFGWSQSAPTANDALFHANRYDYPSTPDGTKHVMTLETTGRGHVIGISSDHRANCEDDDCWRFDGEETASVYGTGTEDFFNFAWGLGDLQALPMHGMRIPFGDPAKRGLRNDGGAFAYRFHTTAAYPFKKSIKFSWVRESTRGRSGRYAGVVYYYKK
jgi:hypothetical protein